MNAWRQKVINSLLRCTHLKVLIQRRKRQPDRARHCHEINLLQRVSQVITGGGAVGLEQLVGEHECTEIPPSLFGPTVDLRHGNKSALIKLLMDETKVHTVDDLPYEENLASAVIIDAMHAIHRWSFRPGETFQDVERRYLMNVMADVPCTSSVHFCCDRYDHTPLA